jgi:hypothetical protein
MNDTLPKQPAWARRVRALGLDGLLGALLDAAGPIAPLVGQLLYVAQPTLGLFIPRRSINQWAELLDRPDGLAELRQMLESDSDTDDAAGS